MVASLPPRTPKDECFLDYSSYVYATSHIPLHNHLRSSYGNITIRANITVSHSSFPAYLNTRIKNPFAILFAGVEHTSDTVNPLGMHPQTIPGSP